MSPVNRSSKPSKHLVVNTLLTPADTQTNTQADTPTSARAARLKRYTRLGLLAASAFLFSACSSVETPELEAQGSVKYIKMRVASDRDDAEERASGKVVTSSTDLELTYDVKRGQQLVGVRFTNLKIPQGAKIRRAEVRFTADEIDRGALKLKVYADDSDNAARFEEKSRNLSKRPATAAKVRWQPQDWRKVGERGGKQFTPNVAPLLQEVVNRRGWQSGNAFAVLFSSESKRNKRVAESYRGNKRAAPQLYVEYIPSSAGPSAPTHLALHLAPHPAPSLSLSLKRSRLCTSRPRALTRTTGGVPRSPSRPSGKRRSSSSRATRSTCAAACTRATSASPLRPTAQRQAHHHHQLSWRACHHRRQVPPLEKLQERFQPHAF